MMDVGPLQFEVLGHLWEHGPQTVADVHARLNAVRSKPLAYTTTLTVLRNLARRNLLSQARVDKQRGHLFTPLVPRDELVTQMVKDFVQQVFRGDADAARAAFAAL